MDVIVSRRRWIRLAGLTIIAGLLGLYAWAMTVGHDRRLAIVADSATSSARLVEERLHRLLDRVDSFAFSEIEPLLRELGGPDRLLAILDEAGTTIVAEPPGPAPWLAAPLANARPSAPQSRSDVADSQGRSHIVHYRPLAGWPLTVAVAAPRDAALSVWRDRVLGSGALMLLLIAGVATLNEWLIREIRRRRLGEARFRDFAEATSDWLWEQGPDLRFTYLSPQVATYTGSDIASHIGRTRREMKPIVSEAILAAHEADLQQRRPFRNFTFARVDDLGRRHHVSISGRPFFDATGAFAGYRGTGRDITAEVEAWDVAVKAQERLDQQHRLLQAIIDTVPAAISVKDRELRYILINDALKKRVLEAGRVPGGNILGKRASEVFGVAFGKVDEELDRRLLDTGVGVPFHEVQAADRDGVRHTQLSTRLLLNPTEGGLTSILSVIIDVTEQRQAERRLREAIEAMNAGFAMFDAADRLVVWNRRYAELWCASADPVLTDGTARVAGLLRQGMPFAQLTRGLAGAGVHRAFGAADAETWIEDRIVAHQETGGTAEMHVEDSWIRLSSHRTEDGGHVTLMTDVTQLKQRETELASRTSLLRATLESLAEGVAVVDFSGRYLAWNRPYIQLAGMPANFAGGTLADAINEQSVTGAIDPATAATVLEGWHRAIAAREPVHIERNRADGAHIEVTGLPIAGIGHVISLRDVTRERRTMVQLQEARDRADASNRAKSAFLANMSHELRTPLNAIMGFAEVMEQELLGPLGSDRYIKYAADIRWSGAHLLRLISDVLDLSKIEAGRTELLEEELDVVSLTRDCMRLLDDRVREAGLRWIEHLPDDLPALKADTTAIRQILLNLLTNAVKFTPDGTIAIEARHLASGEFRLRIADTGIGIPEDELPHVFEPFRHRSNALISRAQEGTGLGLSICKRLMEMHGGTIELHSVPGEGTVVTLLFPARRVVETISPEAASRPERRHAP